jgi:hypothetical protein
MHENILKKVVKYVYADSWVVRKMINYAVEIMLAQTFFMYIKANIVLLVCPRY